MEVPASLGGTPRIPTYEAIPGLSGVKADEIDEAELPVSVKPPPPPSEQRKNPVVLVPPSMKRLKYWMDHDGSGNVTYTTKAAKADESRLALNTMDGFEIGMEAVLNPGSTNEEVLKIIGITDDHKIIFSDPMQYSHAVGESVLSVEHTVRHTPAPTPAPTFASTPKPKPKHKSAVVLPPPKRKQIITKQMITYAVVLVPCVMFLGVVTKNFLDGRRGMHMLPGNNKNQIPPIF